MKYFGSKISKLRDKFIPPVVNFRPPVVNLHLTRFKIYDTLTQKLVGGVYLNKKEEHIKFVEDLIEEKKKKDDVEYIKNVDLDSIYDLWTGGKGDARAYTPFLLCFLLGKIMQMITTASTYKHIDKEDGRVFVWINHSHFLKSIERICLNERSFQRFLRVLKNDFGFIESQRKQDTGWTRMYYTISDDGLKKFNCNMLKKYLKCLSGKY